MGYSIIVEAHFSAAHRLKGYRGRCETQHGHNWKVEVTISGEKLDKIGMVMDFKVAKRILSNILSSLDHKDLNKTPPFKKQNPTSELIAEFIFNRYQKRLKAPLRLKKVMVWETPTSSATFSLDD
ncbi:MAG: 6-carboxytetrahydropterin synthase QueD [Candidatus Omnitrophica bacterium]|nr:6-carboxytetrahydropterin synthase QueD [Candidatus Omnitrophota bacterium]